MPAVWRCCSWDGRVVRGGTGDAEALACRADVVGFLYFEGLLLMRSAANDKVQVLSLVLRSSPSPSPLLLRFCVLLCALMPRPVLLFPYRWHLMSSDDNRYRHDTARTAACRCRGSALLLQLLQETPDGVAAHYKQYV